MAFRMPREHGARLFLSLLLLLSVGTAVALAQDLDLRLPALIAKVPGQRIQHLRGQLDRRRMQRNDQALGERRRFRLDTGTTRTQLRKMRT